MPWRRKSVLKGIFQAEKHTTYYWKMYQTFWYSIFYIIRPKYMMSCLQIRPISFFRQFEAFRAFSGSWRKKLPIFESMWAQYPLGILFVKKKYKIWAVYRLLSAFFGDLHNMFSHLIFKNCQFLFKKGPFYNFEKKI